MNSMDRAKVVELICAQYVRDGVRPEHVHLQADGEIVVDRRSAYPRLVPVVVGRWK